MVNELDELGIHSLSDIEKHLPELPERDYENSDIRKGLKATFSSFHPEVKKEDYMTIIDDRDTFSVEEIISMLQ